MLRDVKRIVRAIMRQAKLMTFPVQRVPHLLEVSGHGCRLQVGRYGRIHNQFLVDAFGGYAVPLFNLTKHFGCRTNVITVLRRWPFRIAMMPFRMSKNAINQQSLGSLLLRFPPNVLTKYDRQCIERERIRLALAIQTRDD